MENGAFGGTDGGIFKSTDGGTTWKQLTAGLPAVIAGQPRRCPPAIRRSFTPWPRQPRRLRRQPPGGRTRRTRRRAAPSDFYKSVDGGEHWVLATGPNAGSGTRPIPRPLVRIGGGDLPTITVDPKNDNVVYSCSTVFWRTEDGGLTWSAVRGAPGGDDYQKSWINPNQPEYPARGQRPGRRGLRQSRRIVE